MSKMPERHYAVSTVGEVPGDDDQVPCYYSAFRGSNGARDHPAASQVIKFVRDGFEPLQDRALCVRGARDLLC